MTEVLWPPDLAPSAQTWNILGNAASFVSPLNGATRTYGRPGVRMGCTITLPPINGQNRARMLALLAALKDRSNRILIPDFATAPRGSFPSAELLTNGDFGSGTTGWSLSPGTLSASDRVLRATTVGNTPSGSVISQSGPATVTQYAPYAVRGMFNGGDYSATVDCRLGDAAFGSANGFISSAPVDVSTGKLVTAAGVTLATSMYAGFGNYSTSTLANQYQDMSWSSLAQCILVDGSPNDALRSDQFDNAAWTKTELTASANAGTAPDGTSTMDSLVESSTPSVQHLVIQSITRTSRAEDRCAHFVVARNSGTRNVEVWIDDGSGNGGSVLFDLGAGTAGTATNRGTGTNTRGFCVALGSSRFACYVIARVPATTTSRSYLYFHNGSTTTYTGDGTSSVFVWRGGNCASSVPVRFAQTTTAAVAASTQTGRAILVKGLPVSTTGILLAGDAVEIGGQRNSLTVRLDSDAAGNGVMVCGNPWRSATDGAVIHVNTPMCRMLLSPDQIDIDTMPGRFSPVTLELVEAID